MSVTIDWTNSRTFTFSDEAYLRSLKKETRLNNCAARPNSKQSMLEAMLHHKGSYAATRIDGKSLDETIRDL